MRFSFVVFLALGCSTLQLGPAGSPTGGPYCFQEPGKADACYETEGERAAAQSRRQEELAAAQRRQHEAAMFPAGETKDQKYWREAEERKAAEAQGRERVYAERNRQRQEAADAKAARAAEVKAMAADKTYAVPAISAIMCSIQDELTKLRADLAREQRGTATSGVTNLRARDEIGREIVDDQDELAGWRAALQRFGATQQPCAAVAGIVACRNSLDTCDEASRQPAEVWDKEQATLWGSDRDRPHR
jgi:hypothetical protein